ncbi:hypothetical protein [Nonomuraea sp. NPDC049158]|uniref:dual OB domain-containing protein n=1 Tax=Nonomuraea sp. NPDC049158 TaxID=3155649 RepID=UPI0033DD9CD7
MTTFKTLVCLANSRKLLGRCVAGIVEGGQTEWIRPISARLTHELSQDERQYEDGSDPRVLDIISVPLRQPEAHSYQSENWRLDLDYYWRKIGQAGWDKLLTLEQHPRTLWINGSNTYHGYNDRVLMQQANTLVDSLKLIRVDRVTLRVHAVNTTSGEQKRVVRAQFRHAGLEYVLRVTDPEYEREYLTRSDGLYKLGEAFMTVSLGEPFDGYTYKLVAAIMERAKIETGSKK